MTGRRLSLGMLAGLGVLALGAWAWRASRGGAYASVTSKTHRLLPPSVDALSVASTGRPKTFSHDSFWCPTEQLQKHGGVREVTLTR